MKKKNVFALIAGIAFLVVLLGNVIFYFTAAVDMFSNFVEGISSDEEENFLYAFIAFNDATSYLMLILASLFFALGALKDKKKLLSAGAVFSIIDVCYLFFIGFVEIGIKSGVFDFDISSAFASYFGGSFTVLLHIAMFVVLLILIKKSSAGKTPLTVLMIVTISLIGLYTLIAFGSCITSKLNMLQNGIGIEYVIQSLFSDSLPLLINLATSAGLILICLWLGLKPKAPAAVPADVNADAVTAPAQETPAAPITDETVTPAAPSVSSDSAESADTASQEKEG